MNKQKKLENRIAQLEKELSELKSQVLALAMRPQYPYVFVYPYVQPAIPVQPYYQPYTITYTSGNQVTCNGTYTIGDQSGQNLQ